MLTFDEGRRIAVNVAKLPELLGASKSCDPVLLSVLKAAPMTEFIVLVLPWLFVTNTLLFGALSAISFLRRQRMQFVLFLWATIGFALGALLLLD